MAYTALKNALYRLGLDEKSGLELSLFVRGIPQALATALRPHRTQTIPQGSYLHLGCGGKRLPGFINVDRYQTPGVDLVIDTRKALPFPDGSVGGIFHEHFLEHIDVAAATRLLTESFRVLAPGARLRFAVPDLTRYLRAYRDGDAAFAALVGMENYAFPAQIINYVFGHAHRFVYDYQGLHHLLSGAGFVEIREAQPHDSPDSRLNQENRSPSRLAETLVVEARKPAG